MAKGFEKKVLGRGLRSLIPNPLSEKEKKTRNIQEMLKDLDEEEVKVVEIPLIDITPNEYQHRQDFGAEELKELAASIKSKGIMQPIVVRQLLENVNSYEIIAGERRYRACKMLHLEKIPAIIKEDVSNKESSQLALIENLQRKDLNLIEKAQAYRQIKRQFGLNTKQLAEELGYKESSMANTLRLLNLPNSIQEKLQQGLICFNHAKVLLSLENKEDQLKLCEQVLTEKLTVRDLNKIAKTMQIKDKFQQEKNVYILKLEEKFQHKFGTKVKISHKAKSNKGSIRIEYYSNDDLERILENIKW